MGNRFRIAVIGAGDMGNRHVEGWQLAGHDVVSVVDIDRARAQDVARRYRVPSVYTEYEAAIADPHVDIVSICLPLAWHAPVTVCAAERGKHIFCEKPLARSWAEADRMEAAVSKAGVHFGIGFQRNLAPGVALLAQWVQEGRFGRPLVFSSDLLQEVRPKPAMHDRDGNNGPLTNAGCHYYLLWQTVLQSRPQTVYAQGRVLAQGRPEVAHVAHLAIDTAVLTIAYESGDIATMTVSWGLAARCQLRGRPHRLFGPKGGVEGDLNAALQVYDHDRVETVQLPRKNLHQDELALFADALARGQPAPVGFVQGKEMLAVTLAILQSIATGEVVVVRGTPCA